MAKSPNGISYVDICSTCGMPIGKPKAATTTMQGDPNRPTCTLAKACWATGWFELVPCIPNVKFQEF